MLQCTIWKRPSHESRSETGLIEGAVIAHFPPCPAWSGASAPVCTRGERVAVADRDRAGPCHRRLDRPASGGQRCPGAICIQHPRTPGHGFEPLGSAGDRPRKLPAGLSRHTSDGRRENSRRPPPSAARPPSEIPAPRTCPESAPVGPYLCHSVEVTLVTVGGCLSGQPRDNPKAGDLPCK